MRMVVYVEYVLLSNFFIDAFLAYITLLSLKTKAGRLRIALSALIGSCFAVAVPYINFAAAGVVKVLMLMVMTAVMCKYPCFKRYLLTTLVYFVYTAALGGAVLLINNMAASEFISALYYPESLVGAYIAAGGIVLVYVSRQIAGYMARKRMCGSECKVVLLAGGAEISCEGFIDTGNTLIRGGKGVIVIDRKLAKKLIGKGAAQSWKMDNRGGTMIDDKFNFGFAIDWMRKDLGLCLAEAKKNGSSLPTVALIDQFYGELQAKGEGRSDTSCLIKRLPH